MSASSLTNLSNEALRDLVLGQKALFDTVAEMTTEQRNTPGEKCASPVDTLRFQLGTYLPMLETEVKRRGLDPSTSEYGLNLTVFLALL